VVIRAHISALAAVLDVREVGVGQHAQAFTGAGLGQALHGRGPALIFHFRALVVRRTWFVGAVPGAHETLVGPNGEAEVVNDVAIGVLVTGLTQGVEMVGDTNENDVRPLPDLLAGPAIGAVFVAGLGADVAIGPLDAQPRVATL
jgi:hypothetical protein